VVDVVKSVFEQADAAMSVLHTGLANMNAILHVAPMVLNAGRIEGQEAFDFYRDGITRSVSRVVQAMDDERMAVARSLAVEVPTLLQWAASTYGPQADDMYQLIQVLHRDVYGPLSAPATLRYRYLSEDVPCGAVPICELGGQIGVPTPVTAACIALVDALLGTSWMQDGRTMERLGLSGLSADDLKKRLAG
jgi:opine dehydrogenase